LTFTKVSQRGAKVISFDEFLRAIGKIAFIKKVSEDELKNIIGGSKGPILVGSTSEANRFSERADNAGPCKDHTK
jgi:bacteriocin-like protein